MNRFAAALCALLLASPAPVALRAQSVSPAGLQAEDFPGHDIAEKVTAAFASQAGTAERPATSAVVNLHPGQQYIWSGRWIFPTNWTAPFISDPVLDCHGSALVYRGKDSIGLELLARNTAMSGEIRNCNIHFETPGSHVLMHSSTWFRWHDGWLTFDGAPGNPGLDMVNDDSPAFGRPAAGGYFEENFFSNLHFGAGPGSCGITWRQSPSLTSGGSFFYNWFYGIHVDNAEGSNWLCTQTSPSPKIPELRSFGSFFQIHANGGGSIFNVARSTAIVRAAIFLAGEANAGGAYDATVHGDGVLQAWEGYSLATGFTHHYLDGAGQDRIRFGNSEPVNYDDFSGRMAHVLIAKEIGGSDNKTMGAMISDGTQTKWYLPRMLDNCHGDALPDDRGGAYWQIVDRATNNRGHEVAWAEGKSGAPQHNQIYASNRCEGIFMGQGYHDGTAPAFVLPAERSVDLTLHSYALTRSAASGKKTAGQYARDFFTDDGTLHHQRVLAAGAAEQWDLQQQNGREASAVLRLENDGGKPEARIGGDAVIDSLKGKGNAVVCVNAEGRLYRGTATGCPQ